MEVNRIIQNEERAWRQDLDNLENNSQPNNDSQVPETPCSTKKARGRPKSATADHKDWSEEEIFSLIEAWHTFEQLYNVKHPFQQPLPTPC